MCIYCNESPYMMPIMYNPKIDAENYDLRLAQDIFCSCLVIQRKASFYVDSNGRLNGYRKINAPMRTWSNLRNKLADGERKQQVADKIIELFTFVLNINTKIPLTIDDRAETSLGNTEYTLDSKFCRSYADLAEKILKKYSHHDFPELFRLAHRVFHERAIFVPIRTEAQLITAEEQVLNGQNEREIKLTRNVASAVKGTIYASTTVWNT